jgi:hypothetical protein
MIIRVEPREFFMSTVYLIFNREQPEPEDDEINRYLAEHQLDPKRRFEATSEERPCQVWQFGGCYLGTHLERIIDIQRRYLEAEMLAQELPRLLMEGTDAAAQQTMAALPAERFQELVGRLVEEFHRESSFGADEQGSLTVTLEPTVVRQRFQELLAGA